jgi:hypothetical protein
MYRIRPRALIWFNALAPIWFHGMCSAEAFRPGSGRVIGAAATPGSGRATPWFETNGRTIERTIALLSMRTAAVATMPARTATGISYNK